MASASRRLVLGATSVIGVIAVGIILLASSVGPSSPPTSKARPVRHMVSSVHMPVSDPNRPSHVRPRSSAKYGGLPSWLPKAKVPVGRVVRASEAHPALAIQGDTVLVHLAHGETTVTTVGPEVPEEGKFPVPATSPCSFSVSLAAGRGVVPIRRQAFTILDERGHVHHPRVRLRNGGPLPARLKPGHIVTLTVRAVLPTGGGRLRWAPNGPRPIASWDFDVEID
jgi:hypothetical protein